MPIAVAQLGTVTGVSGYEGFSRRKPGSSFSLFLVVWTWVFMALAIALAPIDPTE